MYDGGGGASGKVKTQIGEAWKDGRANLDQLSASYLAYKQESSASVIGGPYLTSSERYPKHLNGGQ